MLEVTAYGYVKRMDLRCNAWFLRVWNGTMNDGSIKTCQHHVNSINDQKLARRLLNIRTRQLNCFCKISQLIAKTGNTLDEIFEQAVNLLASSSRYPEITCVRITLGNKQFKTNNFRVTRWKQSANLIVRGLRKGRVEFYYSQKEPEEADCMSIQEEQELIDGFAWVLSEVCESKEAENQLVESQRFASNLLKYSPNPILVLNKDFSIGYVNPAFEKMSGFYRSEIIGTKAPFPFWTEEDFEKTDRMFKRAMINGANRLEACFKRKDGKRFWVYINSVLVKNGPDLQYYLSNWVDITDQKHLRDNMHFYIREITRAQEEERKRIARDLHDETLQSLTSLYNDIDGILMGKQRLAQGVLDRLKQLRGNINNIVEETRRFSNELRPGLLDKFGLVPSLELLAEEVRSQGDLQCIVRVIGSERRLIHETEITMYRVAQEALHNIVKHSKATKARITIKFGKNLKMEITDNGTGFLVPELVSDLPRNGKFGVLGMNERVRLLNGHLQIDSKVGKGTKITANLGTSFNHYHYLSNGI